jgi:hypothetical protein
MPLSDGEGIIVLSMKQGPDPESGHNSKKTGDKSHFSPIFLT